MQVENYIAKVNNPQRFFDLETSAVQLDQNDIDVLYKTTNEGVKKLKVSFLQALCHISLFCRKSCRKKHKYYKVQKMTADKFEDCLDIR